MDARYVIAAVFAFLLVSSAAFAVDPTGGAEPTPARFDDAVQMGMTGVDVVKARSEGYEIPRAQAFYSQYRYVVGYYGIESLVAELNRQGHAQQFGMPLAIFVTDYATADPHLTEQGYITLPSGRTTRWVEAEDAHFVVGSDARTTAGPAVVPFSDRAAAASFADEYGGEIRRWDAVSRLSVDRSVATSEAMTAAVENRSAWANETVSETRRLLDRPVSVTVGEDAPTVQAAVEQAPPNTTVRVPAGTHRVDTVRIEKPITLRGAGNDTHLQGDGDGSVVRAFAPRVGVASLRIDGVGGNASVENVPDVNESEWDYRVSMGYGYADTAVEFEAANGSLVSDVHVDTPANGVTFRDTYDAAVTNVTVLGSEEWQDGFMGVMVMRSRPVVQDSTFTGGRDAVYTHRGDGIVVRRNRMDAMRFGVHEMYTSDALVADNEMRRTNVGAIVMTRPRGNALVGNDVRDSNAGVVIAGSDSYAADNVLVGNRYGMHVSARRSIYEDNVVLCNEVGARAASIIPTNVVTGNDFVGNDRYVLSTVGPLRVWTDEGEGNYWSGAPGGDADGDGVLDRSFRPSGTVDSRVSSTRGAPTLAASPSVTVLRQLQGMVPAMRPTGVVDTAPSASPNHPDAIAAANATCVAG
ncbi:NosD domain-containing protein [Halobacteriaceae archaeon GCM10025711]